MARVITHEFASILKAALCDTADIVRVIGARNTPGGPRVLWRLDRQPDPDVTKLSAEDVRRIAEAASRYLAVRWRNSPEPRPVPRESWDVLMREFPRIYDAPTETNDGWHWLLVATAEWLIEDGLPANYSTRQVKEKFGGLRFYHDGSPSTQTIARAVEHLSYGICDACGAPGRLRVGGWTRTLCDAHAAR